ITTNKMPIKIAADQTKRCTDKCGFMFFKAHRLPALTYPEPVELLRPNHHFLRLALKLWDQRPTLLFYLRPLLLGLRCKATLSQCFLLLARPCTPLTDCKRPIFHNA